MELGGANCKNRCARAYIEQATAFPVILYCFQTELRGLVSACAESHARIDLYNNSTALVREFLPRPGRCNQKSLAYGKGLITLFPFLEPVIVRHFREINSMKPSGRI